MLSSPPSPHESRLSMRRSLSVSHRRAITSTVQCTIEAHSHRAASSRALRLSSSEILEHVGNLHTDGVQLRPQAPRDPLTPPHSQLVPAARRSSARTTATGGSVAGDGGSCRRCVCAVNVNQHNNFSVVLCGVGSRVARETQSSYLILSCVGALAGTATVYAFVLHGFAC